MPDARPVAGGHVSAGDRHTAAAGAAVLRRGGNAVDAAVAATLAAFSAEPVLTAPFGGGFALVAGPHLAPVAYDFFADIPGQGLPPATAVPELDFRGIEVSFGPTTQTFHVGRGATAVPLLLAGLLEMQAAHGRLPLPDVMQPAIALAEQGVGMSAQVNGIAHILTPIVTLTPQTAGLFAPRGQVLAPGEPFVSPELGQFLRRVAGGRVDDVRAALLADFGPPTGRITEADLAHSQVATHAPVVVDLGAYQIALNPPPSVGGLLVGFGLQLLAGVPESVWRDEAAAMSQLLACMAVTQGARSRTLDPATNRGSGALSAAAAPFLAAAHIDGWRQPMAEAMAHGPPAAGYAARDLGSTTHVSAIDGDGMACGITSSNGEGCGHVVPGAGVMANNFLGEEDINPGGFHRRPPGERMTSMMCPTIVLKDGRPILALGTGGSNRIRTALLQVLVHHLLRGLPLDAAVKMPRLHYEGGPLFVEREVFGVRLGEATLRALGERVAKVVPFDAPNMFFGGVHAAAASGPGVGDPRRGGAVVSPGEVE